MSKFTADRESVLAHLIFPLRGGSVLVLIVFSLLFTLVKLAGLFGIWLGFMLLVLLSGYAFRLMDSVAEGRREPPVMEGELVSGATERRPIWLTFIVVSGYWFVQALEKFAPWPLATVSAGLMFALVPAAIALLGLRQANPVSVLNPLALMSTAREMGWYYFAALITIVLALALNVFAASLPLAAPFVSFVQLYALFAVFSVTGGALYSQRHALGTRTVRSPEQSETRRVRDETTDREHVLDEIYRLARIGRMKEAYAHIRQEVANNAGGLPYHEAVFRSLGNWENKALALRVGQDLVSELIAGKRSGDAMKVTEQCLMWEPGFRPARAAEAIRLAKEARLVSRPAIARQLLQDFETCYPDDPALEIAQRLREELRSR